MSEAVQISSPSELNARRIRVYRALRQASLNFQIQSLECEKLNVARKAAFLKFVFESGSSLKNDDARQAAFTSQYPTDTANLLQAQQTLRENEAELDICKIDVESYKAEVRLAELQLGIAALPEDVSLVSVSDQVALIPSSPAEVEDIKTEAFDPDSRVPFGSPEPQLGPLLPRENDLESALSK